jgi:hypothetical protein
MTGLELLDIVGRYAGIAVTTFFAGGAGAYFSEYLKKKGENLATHEDINKLVDQVRAVTQATKEIEAKISDEVWNRQRLWEMKRDLLIATVKLVGQSITTLSTYFTVYRRSQNAPEHELQIWAERRLDSGAKWDACYVELMQTAAVIEMACDQNTKIAYRQYFSTIGRLTAAALDGDSSIGTTEFAEQLEYIQQVILSAIRSELGFTPQSSESSAAPSLG